MLKAYFILCETSEVYQTKSVDELVCALQQGHIEVFDDLVKRMRNSIEVYVRKYYYIERDIVYQQCLITLYKTALKYDKMRSDSFELYYFSMLKYYLLTMASRERRKPKFDVVSIDSEDAYNRPIVEQIADTNSVRPEVESEVRALIEELTPVNLQLSPLEHKVLKYAKEGMTVQVMALLEEESVKTIQNTITRIKNKVRKHILNDSDN